jgi:hypothetical protein
VQILKRVFSQNHKSIKPHSHIHAKAQSAKSVEADLCESAEADARNHDITYFRRYAIQSL